METFNRLMSVSRTTEVNAVAGRIIAEYEKNDWTSDTHLTGIFNLLKQSNTLLTSSINRIKAESDLEQKDEIRDDKIRSVYYLILGFTHHPDLAIKTAAEEVYKVFEHYGVDIVGKSYAIETSLIQSLLVEFAHPDLQPSISALPGLNQLIASLTTAQNEFEAASILYEEEKAAEGTKENASQIKKEVVVIINDKLVVYLRAMIQVDETKYGELTRTTAQIINDNNEIVKKRKKKPQPTIS
jgi:hypothetical protein